MNVMSQQKSCSTEWCSELDQCLRQVMRVAKLCPSHLYYILLLFITMAIWTQFSDGTWMLASYSCHWPYWCHQHHHHWSLCPTSHLAAFLS